MLLKRLKGNYQEVEEINANACTGLETMPGNVDINDGHM
jgi:hypothetical protein